MKILIIRIESHCHGGQEVQNQPSESWKTRTVSDVISSDNQGASGLSLGVLKPENQDYQCPKAEDECHKLYIDNLKIKKREIICPSLTLMFHSGTQWIGRHRPTLVRGYFLLSLLKQMQISAQNSFKDTPEIVIF